MKLENIIAFIDFYNSVAQDTMNIKLAYKLNKIVKENEDNVEFYQEKLQQIFQDCVECEENGRFKTNEVGNYILKKDKVDEFTNRFKELREIEIDFDENNKIDINLLQDVDISPIQLSQIQDFIQ